ncbi:Heavy metal-associated isoprenylated plant protein 41 [Bienertia sinuspersici]
MHQGLVHDFFSNARWLLRYNGEIHVTHKTKPPYSCWNLKQLARENSLLLKECVPFDIKDYPFYENKRGHGSTSDEPFDCRDSCTFKFCVATLFPANHFSRLYNFLSPREPLPRVRFIVKAEVGFISRAAGCAGVLIDENQSVRAKFLGPQPYTHIDAVELLAVKSAVLMFERSELCSKNVAVDIETDSNVAVSWIRSEFGNPIELEADLREIRMALGRIPNRVEFCCNYRENRGELYHMVHQLAVEATSAPKLYEAWLP